MPFLVENMILFLTSSPCGTYEKIDGKEVWEMSREFGFTEKLKEFSPEEAKWMIIAASPDEYQLNDQMAKDFYRMMSISGISLSCMELCDGRNGEEATRDLSQYDGIILGGGHVPTQKKFFEEIHLRDKLKDYDGIIMGISAGTMNSAEVVYSTPELEGEARDPKYQRFLSGLGLTRINVIPHIQKARYDVIDGFRLIEDIALSDSIGNVFYALPDGSYILQMDGREVLYGEAIRIADGKLEEIAAKEGLLLTCRIQEDRMPDKREMHDYLESQLDLPDYYGRNLDALFECLTEMGKLVIYYEKEEPEPYKGLRRTFGDAAWENPDLTLIIKEK